MYAPQDGFRDTISSNIFQNAFVVSLENISFWEDKNTYSTTLQLSSKYHSVPVTYLWGAEGK